jgi:putative transposase
MRQRVRGAAEEVYLKAYNTVSEARTSIGQHFEFYNRRRPYSSLDRMKPEQFYFNARPVPKAA